MTPHLRTRPGGRRGYVMLVALILMALLTVIGLTSLRTAGVDVQVAHYNRKHMVLINAAAAGSQHGRAELQVRDPSGEQLDSGPDSWGPFINSTDGESVYGGSGYAQNLGLYVVEAVYQRCSQPPPGYSTELGRQSFRSDYWAMTSTATFQDFDGTTFSELNDAEARSVSVVRKVVQGTCKIR